MESVDAVGAVDALCDCTASAYEGEESGEESCDCGGESGCADAADDMTESVRSRAAAAETGAGGVRAPCACAFQSDAKSSPKSIPLKSKVDAGAVA